MAKQSIKAEIELDPSKAVNDASRASKKIHDEMGKAAKSGEGGVGGKAKQETGSLVATSLKLALGFAAVAKSVEAVIQRSGQFGQMKRGLESVLPAAEMAGDEIEKLRQLAGSPGLEFDSVVEAHKRFLALKQSASDSRSMIAEIGNALKVSGRPAEDLTAVAYALAQTDADGLAVVGTLHEMTKTSVAFRQAFKAGFGTDRLRELEALRMTSDQFVSGFRKGLGTLKTAQADAGDGLKNMRQLADVALTDLSRGAVWAGEKVNEIFGPHFRQGLNELRDLAGVAPLPLNRTKPREAKKEEAVKEDNEFLARREKRLQKIQDEIDLEWDLGYARMREADLFARIEADAPSRTEEQKKQYELQKQKTDEAAVELEVKKSLLSVMRDNSLTEAEAVALIKERVFKQRELTNAQEAATKQAQRDEQAKTLAIRQRDNKIAAAEAGGHARAARMRRSAAIDDKTKELEMMGMGKDEAAAQARQEVRIQRDAEYRQRTGRSRSHGIVSKGGGGISDGANYAGLNYLRDSKSDPVGADFKHKRVGNQQFPSLDRMRDMQTDKGRRKVETSVVPSKDNSEMAALRKDLNALSGSLKAFHAPLASIAKKYAASDLNQ